MLGVEANQDAMLRTILWLKRHELVKEYNKPVVTITQAITAVSHGLKVDDSIYADQIKCLVISDEAFVQVNWYWYLKCLLIV